MCSRELPDMHAISPHASGIYIRKIPHAHVTTITCNTLQTLTTTLNISNTSTSHVTYVGWGKQSAKLWLSGLIWVKEKRNRSQLHLSFKIYYMDLQEKLSTYIPYKNNMKMMCMCVKSFRVQLLSIAMLRNLTTTRRGGGSPHVSLCSLEWETHAHIHYT